MTDAYLVEPLDDDGEPAIVVAESIAAAAVKYTTQGFDDSDDRIIGRVIITDPMTHDRVRLAVFSALIYSTQVLLEESE